MALEEASQPSTIQRLLVDPGLCAARPLRNAIGEPVTNFLIGRLNGVTAVTDIASDLNAEVSADSSHVTITWHCGTKHFSTSRNGIFSLPDHGNNGA
mmetsp:Transcript_78226/g.117694  ORF Transcript_78226/g.117694 Transcript_78226/m.117694 type:complete len:97 (+) Transcript_78226:1485-1775(+)